MLLNIRFWNFQTDTKQQQPKIKQNKTQPQIQPKVIFVQFVLNMTEIQRTEVQNGIVGGLLKKRNSLTHTVPKWEAQQIAFLQIFQISFTKFVWMFAQCPKLCHQFSLFFSNFNGNRMKWVAQIHKIYSNQLNLKADIHTPTVVVFQHKSNRASE